MKIELLIFLSLFVFFLSCSRDQLEPQRPYINIYANYTGIESKETVVSIKDICYLLEQEALLTKSSATDQYIIQPYIGEQSDTLMYIVNTRGRNGWKIFASDKRVPAILAEGYSGYFSVEDGNPGVAYWLKRLADDMKRVRTASDSQLAFSEMEIQLNKSFWGERPPHYKDSLNNPRFVAYGHWEETITSETVVYDSLSHIVAKWDQGYPYNTYCPHSVINPTQRVSAGCVAVAGAQVIHYLHDKIGLPSSMCSDGYCIGNIDSFESDFYDWTTTVWSGMSYNYKSFGESIPEALLLGYVGKQVNMHYHENYSWAFPSRIRNLLDSLGISSLGGPYDEVAVRSSIAEQMPIIVTATNSDFPLGGWHIHTFVIDGYLRSRIKYTHHHYYVLDITPPNPVPIPVDYDTYTYSEPYISKIKINWGWSSQWGSTPVNDGWYTLTGSWVVTNGTTYDYYSDSGGIIYGFAEENGD